MAVPLIPGQLPLQACQAISHAVSCQAQRLQKGPTPLDPALVPAHAVRSGQVRSSLTLTPLTTALKSQKQVGCSAHSHMPDQQALCRSHPRGHQYEHMKMHTGASAHTLAHTQTRRTRHVDTHGLHRRTRPQMCTGAPGAAETFLPPPKLPGLTVPGPQCWDLAARDTALQLTLHAALLVVGAAAATESRGSCCVVYLGRASAQRGPLLASCLPQ